MAATRAIAARSTTAFRHRIGCGPPPAITGSRYDKEPANTWATKPTTSNEVSAPARWVICSQVGLIAAMTAKAAMQNRNHTQPASTDHAAKETGGFFRVSASIGRLATTSPAR